MGVQPRLTVVRPRPTLVDLFAGAGGLSLGFAKAGFEVLVACDNAAPAVETYRVSVGAHVERLDLTDEVTLPPSDVIAGGPPCQSFSSAGRRSDDDDRGTLVRRFAQIVAVNRPPAFVFENVEGFLTAGNGRRVFDLLEPLIEAGYCIHLRKINAANYGVPQHRKRVLAIGGLGWEPTFPETTHSAFGAPGARRAGVHLPLTPTLGEALEGLPEPAVDPPGEPADHFYRPLRDLDRARAELMKPGQTMRDLPEELWHESYRRRAFRRVMDGTPTERRGGAPAGLRRLRPDAPSKAVTSGARSEFLHPTAHRLLTVRECARIQTFPDSFGFCGTSSDRALLIGNAVPPLLANAVARSLLADLRLASVGQRDGALLSFVPTLADAMSPALAHVAQLVAGRYGVPQEIGEPLRLWL